MNRSPLHLAVLKNNFYMVDYLISCGANLNSQDIDMETPLHISSRLGYENITEYLLKKNSDYTLKNIFHETPFDKVCNRKIHEVKIK